MVASGCILHCNNRIPYVLFNDFYIIDKFSKVPKSFLQLTAALQNRNAVMPILLLCTKNGEGGYISLDELSHNELYCY